MRCIILAGLLFLFSQSVAQQTQYSTANAHSHNDYEQAFPLHAAWKEGFGSVEADIFLDNDQLITAHDSIQLKRRISLDSLYLIPIQQYILRNKGFVYADTSRRLQLMIDIKSAAVPTLEKLVYTLKNYPELINSPSLRIVISGNRPPAASYASYPSWIWFDADPKKEYTKEEMDKIAMFSDNFARYSTWSGKDKIPEKDRAALVAVVGKAHKYGKKLRFWNAPDILNSWDSFIEWGIDYINTDHIAEISDFFKQLSNPTFTGGKSYNLYQPEWRNDGQPKKVRNVILLIGDGTGLAQWYAGYTANGGALNVFNMRYTGLSKTSSFDKYITDSAPGATAFSSGTKTNNRAVGVDPNGKKLVLLPQILKARKMKTAIITSGDLRDATPAAFYAHQPERSSYAAILQDLINAPVDMIMGACDLTQQDSTRNRLSKTFDVYTSIDQVSIVKERPVFIADAKAAKSVADGRGDWAQSAFSLATKTLSENKAGFLLMLEGAQIDHGGHANRLPYVVTELLDFDKLIGEAMKFADSNGETLIVVTGDHETGGLTLTGGDYSSKTINGQFSTGHHTAIPVPVFAYGPGSQLFGGVYENTDIFKRILQALSIR